MYIVHNEHLKSI